MAKNSPGASVTAAQLDAIDSTRTHGSDADAHAASTAILGANGAMATKTDADVHAGHGRRTPKTIFVETGDIIVHYASLGRWFKGEESMGLNPDRNIVARCEKAFVYQEGVGALYHDVRHRPLRRFFKPKQDSRTGLTIRGGDIPLIDPAAAKLATSQTPEGTYSPQALAIA